MRALFYYSKDTQIRIFQIVLVTLIGETPIPPPRIRWRYDKTKKG